MTLTADSNLYTFADLLIRSNRPLPELLAWPDGAGAKDTIDVAWAPLSDVHPIDWFHRWGERTDWLRFGWTGDAYRLEFPALARFEVTADAQRVVAEVAPNVPQFTGRHLLLNQVLPLVLSRRGRFVLHAAAISIADEVAAFVGPTGSGKSTLVAACGRRGAAVLADDSLVLRRDGGSWVAVPSYPAVRLWPDALARLSWPDDGAAVAAHYADKRRLAAREGVLRFETRALPLQRVFTLGTGSVPPRPIALDLFAQTFRLDIRDPVESRRLFGLVADLVQDVPVHALDAGLETRDLARAVERVYASVSPVASAKAFGA